MRPFWNISRLPTSCRAPVKLFKGPSETPRYHYSPKTLTYSGAVSAWQPCQSPHCPALCMVHDDSSDREGCHSRHQEFWRTFLRSRRLALHWESCMKLSQQMSNGAFRVFKAVERIRRNRKRTESRTKKVWRRETIQSKVMLGPVENKGCE